MTLVEIWKVIWLATPDSSPITYYFKDDKNIDTTFQDWIPPYPISSYTKELIEVEETSWEYKLCID